MDSKVENIYVRMVILHHQKKGEKTPYYSYPNLEFSRLSSSIQKSLDEMFSIPLNQSGRAALNSLYFYYASFKPHKSSLVKYHLIFVTTHSINSASANYYMKKYIKVFKAIKFTLTGSKANIEKKMKDLLLDFEEIKDTPDESLIRIETDNNDINPFIDGDFDTDETDDTNQENFELFRQNENQLKKILWWRKIKVIFIVVCFISILVLYATLPFLLKFIKSSDKDSSDASSK